MAAMLAFPASFAYAVLRHRLFDVRVIVRQGLQYAMARGVLLSALPVLVVGFVMDIFIHRRESLTTVMADRGLALSVAMCVSTTGRDPETTIAHERELQTLTERFLVQPDYLEFTRVQLEVIVAAINGSPERASMCARERPSAVLSPRISRRHMRRSVLPAIGSPRTGHRRCG